ncbi:MAG: DUF6477 family protein [Pseudomonadota bacterium]
MTDPVETAKKLRRPGLLVRAAKLGATEYDRAKELRRLIPGVSVPNPNKAIELLLDQEQELETIRTLGDASYSVMRHVRVMIALMAEVHLARRLIETPR